MIEFINDHLVAPEYCKLIYDLYPTSDYRFIFHAHTPKKYPNNRKSLSYSTRGYFSNGRPPKIHLMLQGIYYGQGFRGEFGLWLTLLRVSFHEIGHAQTSRLCKHVTMAAYDAEGRVYKYVENLANRFSDVMMEKLSKIDRRLFQPKRLGPYLDGRIVQRRNFFRKWASANPDSRPDWRMLAEYRKFKSGGQFTTGEVARRIGALKDWTPQYSLVRKLAPDLAYKYTDSADREHHLYAYGDIPEIKRRYEIHKHRN